MLALQISSRVLPRGHVQIQARVITGGGDLAAARLPSLWYRAGTSTARCCNGPVGPATAKRTCPPIPAEPTQQKVSLLSRCNGIEAAPLAARRVAARKQWLLAVFAAEIEPQAIAVMQ